MLKLILFFVVAVFTLLYLALFWDNRNEKIHLHFFHQKIDTRLGLMMFAIFLDGIILALLLTWLLGYLG